MAATKTKSKASSNGKVEEWEIVVTSRKTLRTGVGKNGPWTLYSINATRDGEAIDESLSSFNRLPIGREIDVKVEQRPYKNRAGDDLIGWNVRGEHVEADDDIEAKIVDLEARVAVLEGQDDEEGDF